jgi:hypothetical protein
MRDVHTSEVAKIAEVMHMDRLPRPAAIRLVMRTEPENVVWVAFHTNLLNRLLENKEKS